MDKNKSGMEKLDGIRVLSHPVAYQLMELLVEQPAYINELGRKVGMDRRFISYHLRNMEYYNLVASDYEVVREDSKDKRRVGKALRRYTPTEEGKALFLSLKGVL